MLIKQQFSRFYGVKVITHEVSSLEFNIPTKSDWGLGWRRVADYNKAKWWGIHGMFLLKLAQLGWLGQEKNLLRSILLDAKLPQKFSWGWRKLLYLRELTRQFIWSTVEDGKKNIILWVWLQSSIWCCK